VTTPAPDRPPKLVATDLDGTLVRRDGTVSAYTRDVLLRLDEAGVPVVFVTGRPLRWTADVFEHVGSHGLAIVSNGALVWDVAAEKPWLERHLAPEVALDVVGRLRGAIEDIHFATETLDGWSHEPSYPTHPSDDGDERRRAQRVAPIEELLTEPLLKLLALQPGGDADALLAAADVVVGDEVMATHSSFPLLEMSAAGVTKASTLELVAAQLGVSGSDVVAFGDMPNDLPMLTWAGRSYAMADAHPDVRACATDVAPSHDEDGVARVLAGVFDL